MKREYVTITVRFREGDEHLVAFVTERARQGDMRVSSALTILVLAGIVPLLRHMPGPRAALRRWLRHLCTRYGRRRISAVIGYPVRDLEREIQRAPHAANHQGAPA